MLLKINEKKLDSLNNNKISDLDVLKELFQLNQLLKSSKSEKISNYFENYYNDVKVHIVRRDFIDLYPKLEALEKTWATEPLKLSNPSLLSLSDSLVTQQLGNVSRTENTTDRNLSVIHSIGKATHNQTLIDWPAHRVSQNEFVNQKTVFNATFSSIINDAKSSNNLKLSLLDELTMASNEILNTNQLNDVKKWKPSIN